MSSLVDDEISDEVGGEQAEGGLRRRRGQAWLVVGALVVALAAWALVVRPQQRPSLEATATEAPDTLDPCSLVERGELEAILGPIGEPEERPGMGAFPGQRACMVPRPGTPLPAAVIGILGAEDPISLRDDHPQFQRGLDAIDGVGDQAGWIGHFRVAVVAQGQWLLTVQMLEFEAADVTRRRAEQIAALAVTRL